MAKTHARDVHSTDFSGLVTKLLIADLGETFTRRKVAESPEETMTKIERIAHDEISRLPDGPRAVRRTAEEMMAESKAQTRIKEKGEPKPKTPPGKATRGGHKKAQGAR